MPLHASATIWRSSPTSQSAADVRLPRSLERPDGARESDDGKDAESRGFDHDARPVAGSNRRVAQHVDLLGVRIKALPPDRVYGRSLIRPRLAVSDSGPEQIREIAEGLKKLWASASIS